ALSLRTRPWAFAGLLGIGGVDSWHAPLPAVPAPPPPPIYRHLAAAPEPGTVVIFPLYASVQEESTYYVYWTTAYRKPVVGTYASTLPPAYRWTRHILKDFPLSHSMWLMQALQARYVVFHPESFRHAIPGFQPPWERYQRLMSSLLPPEWVLRQHQEGRDILLVLNLERIRQDIAIKPPRRWIWQTLRPEQVQEPAEPEARQALTDGRVDTAWVSRYTDKWQVIVDFRHEVVPQALRIWTDPKDKIFFLWGSSDGQTWQPIYTVPWWVWAGARALPDWAAPQPQDWPVRKTLLCSARKIRYLKITSSWVAGHIALRELQFVFMKAQN
ncbi:MAG: discoidin domain-containing protein, partial [Acidobacteria bacterium]|nr:discoidin domain-containing protein [Acidobacteriota bacterium]MDW7984872.1 hypothetical protein [Acidobacteriota bacterium]